MPVSLCAERSYESRVLPYFRLVDEILGFDPWGDACPRCCLAQWVVFSKFSESKILCAFGEP